MLQGNEKQQGIPIIIRHLYQKQVVTEFAKSIFLIFSSSFQACLVDEEGRYNHHTLPELEGKEVLTSGSQTVLDLLAHDILHQEDYRHSYPYDWRSKTPVVIRSCHQWFINVQDIKDKALVSAVKQGCIKSSGMAEHDWTRSAVSILYHPR